MAKMPRNIERSGFSRDYVGYGGGQVWRIRLSAYTWRRVWVAWTQGAPLRSVRGSTLAEVGRAIESA